MIIVYLTFFLAGFTTTERGFEGGWPEPLLTIRLGLAFLVGAETTNNQQPRRNGNAGIGRNASGIRASVLT